MFADTEAELHAMAKRLGLRREWFQQHPRLPHYDIVPSKRTLALSLGAKAVDRSQVVLHMRKSPVPPQEGR